jgi:hypothetical protein
MIVKIQSKSVSKIVNLNRRKAIRERCLNCSGWIPKDVSNCSFKGCHLYPFRSGRGRQNAKARQKAIRKFCLWCAFNQFGEVSKCPSTVCPLFAYRKAVADRSVEIISDVKNEYIRPNSEDKKKNEYLNMAN